VREGDRITIDIANQTLTVEVSDDELAARLRDWTPPAPHYRSGVFAKYAALVSSAAEGAITRAGL
jgi:dihydroxy-acid dehydratase